MKLLIIEDDAAFAAMLARRMERQGFECHQAHDASDALLACHRLQPSHVLLDMKLASDNGLDLVKPIRAALPRARIVLLTGFASIATAVEAMRRGADDYLAKPADTQTLLKALDTTPQQDAPITLDTMSPERLEWEHLNQVLQGNDGNVSATARQLGMHRRTLQRKLQRKPAKA